MEAIEAWRGEWEERKAFDDLEADSGTVAPCLPRPGMSMVSMPSKGLV